MSRTTTFGLNLSPITRTVFAGRRKEISETMSMSVGVRHDVTNDFLNVLIQYAEAHDGVFEIVGGGDVYDVVVTKRKAKVSE